MTTVRGGLNLRVLKPQPWTGCLEATPRQMLLRGGPLGDALPDNADAAPIFGLTQPFSGPLLWALGQVRHRRGCAIDGHILSVRPLPAPADRWTVPADVAREASAYPQAHDLRRAASGLGRPLTPSWRLPVGQTGGIPTVILPLRLGQQTDVAVGRALTYAQAERSATFEALERHCGLHLDQPTLRGSYRDLRGRARRIANPTRFLLPSAADLAQLGGRWQAYHPELPIDWTPGHSWTQAQAVLLPARLAFFGYAADPQYVNESSSGSALGSTQAEARLHALLELIERDAFLMTWYARRPVPELMLPTDRPTRLLVTVAEQQGYRLQAYATTLDTGIPSVWVLARRVRGDGAASLSSAGAHLDPLKALHAALWEVTASISLLGRQFDPERAARLAEAPQQVQTPLDHFLLFGDPVHARELDFLDAAPAQPWHEAFPEAPRWRGGGPAEHLATLCEQLVRAHGDVYFVDQTRPEVRQLGLHCARALVPGCLPMTFGHLQRRVQGSRRLRALLGPLPAATLRDHLTPHPFG